VDGEAVAVGGLVVSMGVVGWPVGAVGVGAVVEVGRLDGRAGGMAAVGGGAPDGFPAPPA
jgi:hypothetical protein